VATSKRHARTSTPRGLFAKYGAKLYLDQVLAKKQLLRA
jgi:hypothetical protein